MRKSTFREKLLVISVSVAVFLTALVAVALPAVAASTSNITLSYQTAFFDFSVNDTARDLGSVAADTTYWFRDLGTTAPGFALASVNCTWHVSNNSSAVADFYIKGENFTNHTLSGDGSNGADTTGMKAADNATADEASMVAVAPSAGNGNVLGDNISSYHDFDFEAKLLTPSSSSTADNQSGDIQLTAISAS